MFSSTPVTSLNTETLLTPFPTAPCRRSRALPRVPLPPPIPRRNHWQKTKASPLIMMRKLLPTPTSVDAQHSSRLLAPGSITGTWRTARSITQWYQRISLRMCFWRSSAGASMRTAMCASRRPLATMSLTKGTGHRWTRESDTSTSLSRWERAIYTHTLCLVRREFRVWITGYRFSFVTHRSRTIPFDWYPLNSSHHPMGVGIDFSSSRSQRILRTRRSPRHSTVTTVWGYLKQ